MVRTFPTESRATIVATTGVDPTDASSAAFARFIENTTDRFAPGLIEYAEPAKVTTCIRPPTCSFAALRSVMWHGPR